MKTETTKKAGRVRTTTKAVTTPELYSYLKRHRLCRKYLRNLREEHPDWITNILAGKWSRMVSICASFTWSLTPEGLRFWEKHDGRQERGE